MNERICTFVKEYKDFKMNKELLKQILIEQRETFIEKDFGVERYRLKEIASKISLPFVHIITGIRRCGKSTFIRQIIKKYFDDSNFYYVNFEDERLFNFKAENFNDIYEALVELFGKETTFFLDEVQNIINFETFVRRFSDVGFKFFLTGSNAKLLSNEISTKLTGRHIDTYLSPFSFSEFLIFKKYQYNSNNLYKTDERALIKKHFAEFLKSGGMPEYLKYGDVEILFRTYEDIIIKDIAVRHNIGNYLQLKELSQYLISNFARPVSYNSLKKLIGFGSVNTVKNYIQFLESSFLMKKVNRFDYSLKKQIANDKKVYIVDNGFITNISVSFTKDSGRMLENLVYNSLVEKYDIYYYNGKNECDFVCVENKRISQLIQVTQELNTRNSKREIAGISEAMNVFGINKGYILTYDTESEIKIETGTITIMPVWKYILR